MVRVGDEVIVAAGAVVETARGTGPRTVTTPMHVEVVGVTRGRWAPVLFLNATEDGPAWSIRPADGMTKTQEDWLLAAASGPVAPFSQTHEQDYWHDGQYVHVEVTTCPCCTSDADLQLPWSVHMRLEEGLVRWLGPGNYWEWTKASNVALLPRT